jgi:hypothetical protein
MYNVHEDLYIYIKVVTKFIPEMQGWFYITKCITPIHHVKVEE